MAMDVVDYEIKGAEMQFVEVELDPGEAAVGEAGSLFFMDAGIAMDTVFGDGSGASSGLLGKLLGAGKRLITGESLFITVYTNQTQVKQRIAFAAPYPGKILAMVQIGARHQGVALVNSTAVLVLAYTAGGMLAPAAGGLMLQWTPGLGFPALLLGVAALGLWGGDGAARGRL